jgi:hypothetical protein
MDGSEDGGSYEDDARADTQPDLLIWQFFLIDGTEDGRSL